MKALAYDRFGALDVLHVADLPDPTMRPGEVMVALRASSANVIDNRVRSGRIGPPLVSRTFPKIPGADIAGVVLRGGGGVGGWQPGDEVFGAVDPFKGGAFAERVSVPAGQLARKPPSLSFEEAAALPIAGLAALTAMDRLGRVGPGRTVLVHGGSGAVGLFAIQIAKRLGARVTAVAGSGGLAAMQAAGADVVIDYRRQGPETYGAPFDVILNASGALPYAKARPLLARRGVLVEPSPTIPLVIGSKIANLFRARQHQALMTAPRRADLERLAAWVAEGAVRPVIAATVPFAQAGEALAALEAGGLVGKAVVSFIGEAA